jgi:hypothetical protein
MSFNSDLAFGNIYEKKLVELIPNESYLIKEGYFPDYDVEITNNNIMVTYEVKADRYTYKTNNVAIEFECNKSPSGIATTTSDFYAYFVIKPYNLFELYIIPTNIIKSKIEEKEYKKVLLGGDNKRSRLYIMDLNNFLEYKFKKD